MAWTYAGDPAANNRDSVRFELGDVNIKRPLVSDEEIAHAITQEGSNLKAAARCAEHLAAKFAREDIVRTSTFGTEKSEISKQFRMIASRLRRRSARAASLLMPSLVKTDKEAMEDDTTLTKPAFKRGMQKHPDADTDKPFTTVT